MMTRNGPLYRLGALMAFAPGEAGIGLLAGGWSEPDPAGFVWSDGPEADLVFSVAVPARDAVCTLDLMPFRAMDSLPRQQVEIFFNHFRMGYAELDAGRQEVSVYLPRETFLLRTAILTLHIPTARSPAELALSPDRRRLGVALWSFKIAPVA